MLGSVDMDEGLSNPTGAWSLQMGTSRLDDHWFPQLRVRLLCLLLCPVIPAAAFFGMVIMFGVPVLIIAAVTAIVLGVIGGALSAYLRLSLSSNSCIIDGEFVTYNGGATETILFYLRAGVLNLVTLGVYWLIGFDSVATSKARYSRTTRNNGASNIERSGHFGNFLYLLLPRVLITGISFVILYATGLIAIRQHSEMFWNELARPSTRFRPPNMELWELIKSVARNGTSAFRGGVDNIYYNEITTILWTVILLFTAFLLLLPWYRFKSLQWEISNTSVDGYRLRYNATFGSYVAQSYVNLLMIAVPASALIVLFMQQRKITPAAWTGLVALSIAVLILVLGFVSLRMARLRAKNTAVLKPPSLQAPWTVYMVPAEKLHTTKAQDARSVFNAESRGKMKSYFSRYWTLYLLLLIPIIYLIIFRYIPMIFIQIGFKQNNIIIPIQDVPWHTDYGFGWLKYAFNQVDFHLAVRNTLMLNGLDLIFGFPAPIILAILLNELAFKKFKRVSQTIFYMPHFLSWVIIAALAMQLFNGTDGLINMVLTNMGMNTTLPFENNSSWVSMYMWLGIWSGAGWGTIIYLAAITNINPELYEAANVDGAGRLRKIWHVTLPGIRPTIIILLIMRMGGIVGSDFERPFALRTALVTNVSDQLSIFVYLWGIRGSMFSLTAAVGIFQSVICLIFLFGANALAKKFGERGVW
jgi:putative aldouronate transport system permease protein